MKALINNFKQWLNSKSTVENETHVNWFGVINEMKENFSEATIKLSSKDVYDHTEIGTGHAKDIRSKGFDGEIDALQKPSKATPDFFSAELSVLAGTAYPIYSRTQSN